MDKKNLSVSNEDENMNRIVKKIISLEYQENKEFIEYQEARIKELNELVQKKLNGESVDINDILNDLKCTGILDQNNNITERYSSIF